MSSSRGASERRIDKETIQNKFSDSSDKIINSNLFVVKTNAKQLDMDQS